MKYRVRIIERHTGVFEVEADSEEVAIEKAIEQCNESGGSEYDCLEEAFVVR